MFFFQSKGYRLFVSTISIAEFCVKGHIEELPLKNLSILPFNVDHAKRAGEFANILYEAKNSGELIITERPIIINDAKLFAQTDIETRIKYFVTSDTKCINMFKKVKSKLVLNFDIIDIRVSYADVFGVLNF